MDHLPIKTGDFPPPKATCPDLPPAFLRQFCHHAGINLRSLGPMGEPMAIQAKRHGNMTGWWLTYLPLVGNILLIYG